MIEVLAATLIASSAKESYQYENINKFCAYVVGIPYASDNFNDEEWKRFLYCKNTLIRNVE